MTQSFGGSSNSGRSVSHVSCLDLLWILSSVSFVLWARAANAEPTQVTTPPRTSSRGSGPTPNFNGDTPLALHDVPASPGLNLLDLELLHNFVTSTANTLHAEPALKTLWKINVGVFFFQSDA